MNVTDPILGCSDPHRYWTTANICEAVPDVMTPLCWSLGKRQPARLDARPRLEEPRLAGEPASMRTIFVGGPKSHLISYTLSASPG